VAVDAPHHRLGFVGGQLESEASTQVRGSDGDVWETLGSVDGVWQRESLAGQPFGIPQKLRAKIEQVRGRTTTPGSGCLFLVYGLPVPTYFVGAVNCVRAVIGVEGEALGAGFTRQPAKLLLERAFVGPFRHRRGTIKNDIAVLDHRTRIEGLLRGGVPLSSSGSIMPEWCLSRC